MSLRIPAPQRRRPAAPACDGALPCGIEQLAETSGVFAITDILFRPYPPDQDVGRRLQERLLTDHQASLGATLVDRADRRTLDAHRSWGRADVGEVWRPTSATVLRVLVLPVGERTAARLEDFAHHAWTRWPG